MMKNLKLSTLDVMNVEALESKNLLLVDGGHMENVGRVSIESTSGTFDAAGTRVAKEYKKTEIEFTLSEGAIAFLKGLIHKP